MSQNHFTLTFPLKSAADAKAITEQLPALMPDFLKVEDALGAIHYSRFTLLSEKTLLFWGFSDGELGDVIAPPPTPGPRVWAALFQRGGGPPASPVASNADAFAEWC